MPENAVYVAYTLVSSPATPTMSNHNQSLALLSETAQRRRNRHTRAKATPASSKKKNMNPNVQQVDETIAAGHPDSEEKLRTAKKLRSSLC